MEHAEKLARWYFSNLRITEGDQVLKQFDSRNQGSTSGGAAELQQLPEAMRKQQGRQQQKHLPFFKHEEVKQEGGQSWDMPSLFGWCTL
jgi:hypothetical protein